MNHATFSVFLNKVYNELVSEYLVIYPPFPKPANHGNCELCDHLRLQSMSNNNPTGINGYGVKNCVFTVLFFFLTGACVYSSRLL